MMILGAVFGGNLVAARYPELGWIGTGLGSFSAALLWMCWVAFWLDEKLNRTFYERQRARFQEWDDRRTARELGMSLSKFKDHIGETKDDST